MLRGLLTVLLALPFTLLVVMFAISNREVVQVKLFPLPDALVMPLYLLVLPLMALGFLIGAVMVWLTGHKARAAARRHARRAELLEQELAKSRAKVLGADAPPLSGVSSAGP